jgi:ribosomal protein S18 acetylase RimI-like enzyme
MNIQYFTDRRIEASQMAEVFSESGIRRPVDDLDRIERMLANADELVTAWHGERLVGLLRAITDYSYCCYISDLAVSGQYQAQGIGKRLIDLLQQKLGNEEVQYILLSAPKAVGFYEKLGLERADKAFIKRRERNH